MSDLFFETMARLAPKLRAGDLSACEHAVSTALHRLPDTPFHHAVELEISNDPEDLAAHFDRFINDERKRYPIAAVYTEMNGFDINPDRWYCDLFAYDKYGGHGDYDWLSDWRSEYFDPYTVCGLEALQEVYASSAFRDDKNRDASYLSSLMVVIKFQRFIERAAPSMKALSFPLLATAHDFDFIAEVASSRPTS